MKRRVRAQKSDLDTQNIEGDVSSVPENEIDPSLLGKSISDSSEAEEEEGNDGQENKSRGMRPKSAKPRGGHERPAHSAHKKSPSAGSQKSKVVRLNTKENDDEENVDRVGGGDKVLLRIKREPEFGDDEGDFAIYEDDWEELDTTKPTGKEARRRYIHEKAIFQELTHLKRMQIQYGKVQEKLLVRSLVGNFCKMHGLSPADFKFYTFYAWEKFLYDQLKLIYLEERERIAGQAGFSKNGAAQRFSRFENRLRQARAVPINDNVRELTRIYGNGTMTAGARSPNRKQRQQQPQPPSNSK